MNPILMMMAAGIFLGVGQQLGTGGFVAPTQVPINKAIPNSPIDPASLMTGRAKGLINVAEYQEQMKAHAIAPDRADQLFYANLPILNSMENVVMYRRGKFSQNPEDNREIFLKSMRDLGYSSQLADRVLQANEVYATPQDLIRFLVREVLTPQLRSALELDAEYPDTATDEFAKIGMSEELAKNLWAAHWILIDISRAMMVYHRYRPEHQQFWEQEITELGLSPERVGMGKNDILALLKYQDIAPFYREKILSTLYNDLGQIQLRWLIRFRFIDYSEAVYRHERQGLPRTLAEQVTKVVFCVQSITDWKAAVKSGSMSWTDVQEELRNWNVVEPKILSVVRLKVAPEEMDKIADERQVTKKLIMRSLDLGDITRENAKQKLIQLGYSDEQASFMLDVHAEETRLDNIEQSNRSDLTKTEIKTAFRKGAISRVEAREKLLFKGISPEAAEIILDSISRER